MTGVLRAEILKTAKRWMPYVLFLVMVGGAAIQIWLAGYSNYRNSEDAEFAGAAFRSFAFPWSLAALLDSGQFWGAAIFVGILTSSSVATEYNWGTVRQALVRGQSRSEYLAVKLAGTAMICTVGLLLALAVGIAFSLIATNAAGAPITFDVPGGPSVAETGLMILRAALGILPYGLLAFMLTIAGRSTALGVGGTLGYMFGETAVAAILKSVGGAGADFQEAALGHQVASLIAANRIGDGDYNSPAMRELPNPSELPDPNLAALVIVIYCAVFLVIAFAIFQRRDIRPHA